MEGKLRWVAVTAIAPVAWGASYYVTRQFLPEDYPMWGAVIRAIPGGLLLMLLARKAPKGSWWWKSFVLGALNIGSLFVLVYVAAQLLPTSIASTLMAFSPAVMMLLGWPLLRQRPRVLGLAGAVLGLIGVFAMLYTGTGDINLVGVVASVAAMLLTSLGFILSKRWSADVDAVTLTSWQLIAGGLVVVPFAVTLEGAPPALDATELIAFSFQILIATSLAYWAWFAGLRRLEAGAVGLIGLLNPVTGVLLGVLVASELLGVLQAVGIGLVLVGILLGQPVIMRMAQRRRVSSPGTPD